MSKNREEHIGNTTRLTNFFAGRDQKRDELLAQPEGDPCGCDEKCMTACTKSCYIWCRAFCNQQAMFVTNSTSYYRGEFASSRETTHLSGFRT